MTAVQRIQAYLQHENIDAAFITTPDNIFYVSTFMSNPHERLLGVLIPKTGESILLCPFMEVPDVQATSWTHEVVGHKDTDDAWDILVEAIQKQQLTIQSIAIEKSHLSVERYEAMQEKFPNAQFSRLDEQINAMRNIKSTEEIDYLRKAAELADLAVEIGCNEIAEGKTEQEILTAIEFEMKKRGAEKMAFETMVLTGPKTASPHGVPGDRKVQRGDFVLFDLGVSYKGYCSDITRTVAFGEPTEEMKEIYNTVLQAQLAALDTIKPGVPAKNVDIAARSVIEDAGFGDYFPHRIGHGLGISVHEFPSVTGTNEMPLEEGMVFTVEPGIYKTGIAGVRIEDDVVVTANGVEVLSKFPKELKIIQ